MADTFVVAAKPKFALAQQNQFESDESDFNATPAISRGQIFLRSNQFLYCIEAKAKEKPKNKSREALVSQADE